jgi:hypothetical protein
MESTTVADFFQANPHALYVYNFLDMNIFYVEKTKEDEEEGFEDFVVLNAVGELEKTSDVPSADAIPGISKDPSQMTEAEINAMYGLDDLEGEKDPFVDEDLDDEESDDGYF